MIASPNAEQLQGMSQMFIHELIHLDSTGNEILSYEEQVAVLEQELYTLHCPTEVFDGIEFPHTKGYQLAPLWATNNKVAMPKASATNNHSAPA